MFKDTKQGVTHYEGDGHKHTLTPLREEVEKIAEQLHIWYLESTKNIHKLSFNEKAQRSYVQLTNEQKYIDRYIAEKWLVERARARDEGYEAGVDAGKRYIKEAREKEREEILKEIETMWCEVPKNKRIENPLSEKNVNQAILYVGRFNYNKALTDLKVWLGKKV